MFQVPQKLCGSHEILLPHTEVLIAYSLHGNATTTHLVSIETIILYQYPVFWLRCYYYSESKSILYMNEVSYKFLLCVEVENLPVEL